MEKGKDILQLQNISVRYGGVHALNDVSLSLRSGEIVALMGPNGAGKSTVLKAIFGLVPTEGEMRWRKKPFTPVPHRVARDGIAFVPQGRRVFARLTVEENLEIGGHGVNDRETVRRRMRDMMRLFPVLEERKDAPAGALSGGQQQLLAIARGLMSGPEALLLDEPSLGLSPKMVKEVFEKIAETNRRHGTSIMIVEHNITSLLAVAHRGYLLDKGKVVAEGSAANLKSSDTLTKVFTGAAN